MKRNYGIDLLRCVSMFMVAALHILGHGGVLNATVMGSMNYCAAWLLETAAFCAVNCYALISGYVGVRAKYRYSNIIMLWLQVVFYTILITALFFIITPDSVGFGSMIVAVSPVTRHTYWYFTAYFAMFFIMPVLNAGINGLSEKQAVITAVSLFVIFSVLKTASTFFVDTDIFNLGGGYTVIWLCVVYIIGGCIGKFDLLKKVGSVYLGIGYAVCVIFSFGFKLAAENFGIGPDENVFLNYISPTILLSAACLLELFSRIKVNKIAAKIIGFFAPAAFGVYLMHDHPLVRKKLMQNRFAFLARGNVIALIFAVIGTAALIFIVGALIDKGRIVLFNRLKIKEFVTKIDK